MANRETFALITGCSSGIGKELAVAFANRGVTVLGTARRTQSLDELTSKYSNIKALALDLSDPEIITKLKDSVLDYTDGYLDYLVNNAGTHYAGTAMDLEMDEVVAIFQVNVFAVMRLCQIFLPLLRQSPRGRIVQIESVTWNIPVVWQGAYNASKAALSQYSRTLRLVSTQVKPLGVEVIEIVTGFVQSNILHHGLHAPEDSVYLPIKGIIENIKYQGNANGMPAHVYAASITDKLLRRQVDPEIWEGKMARLLRLIFMLPLRLLNHLLYRRFKLGSLRESIAGLMIRIHMLRWQAGMLSQITAVDRQLTTLRLALPPGWLNPHRNAFINESPLAHHARLITVYHLRMAQLLLSVAECSARRADDWLSAWQRVLETCQDIAGLASQWDSAYCMTVDPAITFTIFTTLIFLDLQRKCELVATDDLRSSIDHDITVLHLQLKHFGTIWTQARLLTCKVPTSFRHVW
ncbi:dehydrogenase [Aspergillus niger ATCC 1015]|uniref:Dehydrogenase n=1 Tax=Aspergillus niger (strain ATCC 1015 / CBS 113.46 / FGSC A1144 / LSHB Ac4 / NCTC 3858a / NRRL 328 / USDA 3528.7) TaxID=380704 RepID=G3Y827_ASPNA|nr:dehydrogenase [Aspergillus niger ATCC 1015]